MSDLSIYLGAMSIATTNTKKMVEFYETVFKICLSPQQMGKYLFYSGFVGNMNIILKPNELQEARSGRSRYQLSFVVPNLEEHLQLVERAGGAQTQEADIDHSERYCEIIDPDGNPIELIEFVSVADNYETQH